VPARAESPSSRLPVKDAEDALLRCNELESDLAALRAGYDLYFQGVDRLPPQKKHDAFKKAYLKVKSASIRQTAVKFRVETIGQKLLTYERLWDRILKEIENGTYKRDLAKLKRQGQSPLKKEAANPTPDFDEDLDLSDLDEPDELDAAFERAVSPIPSIAPVIKPVSALPSIAPVTLPPKPGLAGTPKRAEAPPAPLPVIPKPVAPASAPVALSEAKIKAVYDAYVSAKQRCGEDTRSITFESVATTLKKQVPELMRQHNAKSVEFKVIIKEGKAVLRALPKNTL
jgi:hypothetical protein